MSAYSDNSSGSPNISPNSPTSTGSSGSSSSRQFKDAIYKQFARIGKCLSSDKRLELLDLLSQGAKPVEKLAKATGMTVANVSQHLQVLAEACLVATTKKGTFVYYELANEEVGAMLLALWRTGERQLADVQRIKERFSDPQGGDHRITLEEALARQERGEAVLIDVRPGEEYEYAHLPGAISIPMSELQERLARLPGDCDIVAYCRGPYCAYASHAVNELREKGFRAFRLDEGINEWRLRSRDC